MLTPEQQEWTKKFACQALASRAPLSPGSADNPDRMQREQAKSMDNARHYGTVAFDTWRKKHGVADDSADLLRRFFIYEVACQLADASGCQAVIDNRNMLTASNEL
jgi:hypothetical protein